MTVEAAVEAAVAPTPDEGALEAASPDRLETPEEAVRRPVADAMTAPLAPGSLLAPGYQVIGHVHRAETFDVYGVWSQARLCSCVAKLARPDCDDEERRWA